ncbi:transmembrane protein, putative (macronuclear) [Tetrahymena thermophila SB210]|uniref:Transmembrane protein, putative n=1 Tax=Tetrahymena thermophila (strain SB210) TaxID=312017 RepID=I7LXI7_TETTS|nr:transmembrane protein, putative [Tetrahymena thermophila SB210]EAS04717.2 transmembrane protein, putative [Tetrahymena thermophila SB210]|eukprot:XP_001024962.2 transmembrane protein, putative [Tetrahymena thermophila SB210]
MVFNYDGMFFGSKANMTYQNIQDYCFSSKFDSRCQEYFIVASQNNKNTTSIYPPTQFMYDAFNQPFIATGICKKFSNLNQFSKILVSKSSNNSYQDDMYSIICNAIYLENQKEILQTQNDTSEVRIIFEPKTERVLFQSDKVIQQNSILSLEESFLNRIDSQEQLDYFKQQISQFQSQMQSFCSTTKSDIYKVAQSQIISNFTFFSKGQQFNVVQQFTYLIDKNINNNNEITYCYQNNYQLLTISSLEPFKQKVEDLNDQIKIISILFFTTILLIAMLGFVFSVIFSFSFCKQMNISIQHLTNIMKILSIDEDTKEQILLQGRQILNQFEQEEECIFNSSDINLVYESFQNLFQVIIFANQSIYNQDESLSIMQLNQAIQFFKKFQNQRALGICYNNIANIHFSNGRYNEAYDYYCLSVVCCRYELNMYQENETTTINKLEETQQKLSINSQKSNGKSKTSSINKQTEKQIQRKTEQVVSQEQQSQIRDKNQKNISNRVRKQKFYDISKNLLQDDFDKYDILFTRKLNGFKCALFFMVYNRNQSDFDALEVLLAEVEELNELYYNQLSKSNKNQIFINFFYTFIHGLKQDLQSYEVFIKENDEIYLQCILEAQQQKNQVMNINDNNLNNLQVMTISQPQDTYQQNQSKAQQQNIKNLQIQQQEYIYQQQDITISESTDQNFFSLNRSNTTFTLNKYQKRNSKVDQISNGTLKDKLNNKFSQIFGMKTILSNKKSPNQKGRSSLVNYLKQPLNDTKFSNQNQLKPENEYAPNTKLNQTQLNFIQSSLSKSNIQKQLNAVKESKNIPFLLLNVDQMFQYFYFNQLGTYNLLIKQFKSAAENFTRMFEECKRIIPYQKNICIKKMIQIFISFNLTHPLLDQMYIQQISDLSYKITVVYFDQTNKAKNLTNSSKNILNKFYQSNLDYQYQVIDQIQGQDARSQIFDFCQKIIDQLLKYNDDHFGFILTSIEDMCISQNIATTKFELINKNKKMFKQVLFECLLAEQVNKSERKIESQLIQDYILLEVEEDQDISIYNNTKEQEKSLPSDFYSNLYGLNEVKKLNVPVSQKQTFKQVIQKKLKVDLNKSDKNNQNIRKMFYFSIRKAIQELVSSNGAKALHFKLNSAFHNKKNENNHIFKQHNLNNKLEFIKEFLRANEMKKKFFKNVIIFVTSDLNAFDQDEDQFKSIIKYLRIFDIELCILFQNDQYLIEEKTQFENIIFENKYVVNYFFNSSNLHDYLNTCRCSKYHDSIPQFIEYF